MKRELTLPKWEGPIIGWTYKFIGRNFWKVKKYFVGDMADAMREAYLVFLHCRNYYGKKNIAPAHFMSLYKTALYRKFINFALLDYNLRYSENREILNNVIHHTKMDFNDGPLLVQLGECSLELQHVLSIIATAPPEILQILFKHTSINEMNRRIKRWCNVGHSRRNIIRELHKLNKVE